MERSTCEKDGVFYAMGGFYPAPSGEAKVHGIGLHCARMVATEGDQM